MKKDAREGSTESMRLFRELESFYREHPKSTPAVAREVDKIRSECDVVMGQLQTDFDKQHEETTCIFLRRELDYVRGFLPDSGPAEIVIGGKKEGWVSRLFKRFVSK